MVLEVSGGSVDVVSTGGNGGGALDHPVSSGPVSRLPATQNPIISDKLHKNLKVPLMGGPRAQLGARKTKGGPKLTTKNSKSRIFEFPKFPHFQFPIFLHIY